MHDATRGRELNRRFFQDHRDRIARDGRTPSQSSPRDLAMVPDVGPSSEKLAVERTNHGERLVNVADDVVVPMTTLEVVDALRKGRLSEQSLVWRVGMHDWSAVLDVPQLRLAAGSLP